MSLWESLLNLLFPPKCPFCGKVLDTPGICPKCEKTLPWTEEEKAERKLPGSIRCAAPLWYEDAAREGLLRLKFHGSAAAAMPLGELVARCAAEHFGGEFDTVTWVPVSRKRLRKRGYDQTELLCRRACRLWDVKPERLLVKTVDNPPQSGIRDAAARRANVLGVYECRNQTRIRGSNILLLDDIITTGATVSECARMLQSAQAKNVYCAAVAAVRNQKQ